MQLGHVAGVLDLVGPFLARGCGVSPPGWGRGRGGCGKSWSRLLGPLSSGRAEPHAVACQSSSAYCEQGGGWLKTQRTKPRHLPMQPVTPRGAEIAFPGGVIICTVTGWVARCRRGSARACFTWPQDVGAGPARAGLAGRRYSGWGIGLHIETLSELEGCNYRDFEASMRL